MQLSINSSLAIYGYVSGEFCERFGRRRKLMYACNSCFRGSVDPRWELPNRAIMTNDLNEIRKQMVAKCPYCGSTEIHRAWPSGVTFDPGSTGSSDV